MVRPRASLREAHASSAQPRTEPGGATPTSQRRPVAAHSGAAATARRRRLPMLVILLASGRGPVIDQDAETAPVPTYLLRADFRGAGFVLAPRSVRDAKNLRRRK